jgi:large subunit ribosomal protein L31e
LEEPAGSFDRIPDEEAGDHERSGPREMDKMKKSESGKEEVKDEKEVAESAVLEEGEEELQELLEEKEEKEEHIEPEEQAEEVEGAVEEKEAAPEEKEEAKPPSKEEEAEEEEIVEEQTYTIPLSRAWIMPPNKRTPRAMRILKSFIVKNMKLEEKQKHEEGEEEELKRLIISNEVNERIWRRSIEKPPRKLRVRAAKDKDGNVTVYLAKGD